MDKTYAFVKGVSRSKRHSSTESEGATANRAKYNAFERSQKLAEVSEDLETIKRQLMYKEKLRSQAEAGRNYRVCEELTDGISKLTQQRRELQAQEKLFRKKEKQALWYQRKRAAPLHLKKTSPVVESPAYHSDYDSDKSFHSPSSHSTILLSNSDSEPELSHGSRYSSSPQPCSSTSSSCFSLSRSTSASPVFAVPKAALRERSPEFTSQHSGPVHRPEPQTHLLEPWVVNASKRSLVYEEESCYMHRPRQVSVAMSAVRQDSRTLQRGDVERSNVQEDPLPVAMSAVRQHSRTLQRGDVEQSNVQEDPFPVAMSAVQQDSRTLQRGDVERSNVQEGLFSVAMSAVRQDSRTLQRGDVERSNVQEDPLPVAMSAVRQDSRTLQRGDVERSNVQEDPLPVAMSAVRQDSRTLQRGDVERSNVQEDPLPVAMSAVRHEVVPSEPVFQLGLPVVKTSAQGGHFQN